MTKIYAELSKNGFYFGSVEFITSSDTANAWAVDLIAHHAANGVSVTKLSFTPL